VVDMDIYTRLKPFVVLVGAFPSDSYSFSII
jgi:hypothetical protein